jgi:hypothetical protein
MGLEPTTSSLARTRSKPTELQPHTKECSSDIAEAGCIGQGIIVALSHENLYQIR